MSAGQHILIDLDFDGEMTEDQVPLILRGRTEWLRRGHGGSGPSTFVGVERGVVFILISNPLLASNNFAANLQIGLEDHLVATQHSISLQLHC